MKRDYLTAVEDSHALCLTSFIREAASLTMFDNKFLIQPEAKQNPKECKFISQQ